jgi:hypothetical protein
MKKLALMLVTAALVGASLAGPASAAPGDGTVTVVHGIPGLTVDVYVNDTLTLDNFAPDTVTDPITLPAGDYNLKIRGATDPDTAAPILEANATVTSGLNASIVAHLKADGSPTVSVFANNVTPIAAGEGRLTVRHTAAAPAVDVRAGGSVVFPNLTNPNEATTDLAAGVISADVVLAGTSTVAIGPADVDVQAGTSTMVYAVGSASDGNLHLLVQTIGGLAAEPAAAPAATPTPATPASATPVPAAVNTGSGGLVETAGFPMWIALAAGLALLTAAGGGLVLARSRH